MSVSTPNYGVTTTDLTQTSGALALASAGLSFNIMGLSGGLLTNSGNMLNNGTPATRFIVETYNNTNTFGSSLRGRRYRGTVDSPSGVLADDIVLQIAGDGYDGTGIANAKAAILFRAAESWGLTGHGTYISFFTTPIGAISSIERLTVDENGNVGISDLTPGYTLSVSGSGNFTQGLYLSGQSVATYSELTAVSGALSSQTPASIQIFSVSVPTGVDRLFVAFPQPFASAPCVVPSVGVTGNILYQLVGLPPTTSGFYVQLSDVVAESGVSINVTAK